MLRRMKKDVQSELFNDMETIVHCPLASRQKFKYEGNCNKE